MLMLVTKYIVERPIRHTEDKRCSVKTQEDKACIFVNILVLP